jgi:hypothetical protein
VKSALAAAFTTWLALTGLQALATRGASGRVAGLFKDVDSILVRVLDPTIPAIPDRRTTTPATTTSTTRRTS